MALAPDRARWRLDLALTLHDLGDAAAAAAQFEAIRDVIVADPALHGAWLMHRLQTGLDPAAVYQEHLAYQAHYDRLAPEPLAKRPLEGRRLRVGFVSGDFRRHVAGLFVLPVLEGCDRARFEFLGYPSAPVEDELSAHFRSRFDAWRPLHGLDDADAAALVRADAPDVLIDLSGHTEHNRLGVFARRCAPVQASWVGYPGTTGLAAMDYRIVDDLVAPAATQAVVRERLLRLQGAGACFPAPPARPLAPPPSLVHGRVTFAAPNRLSKLNPTVFAAWAAILARVPGAELLVWARGLEHPSMQARLGAALAAHGVAPERLRFGGLRPYAAHLDRHAEVDIVLDSFPYTGGTTTRTALWMGVPVVTLEGLAIHERMSAAMLRQIGLDDCVATDPEEYVARAVALAGDPARLQAIRQTARPRLLASPLFDPAQFARAFEDGLMRMWRGQD